MAYRRPANLADPMAPYNPLQPQKPYFNLPYQAQQLNFDKSLLDQFMGYYNNLFGSRPYSDITWNQQAGLGQYGSDIIPLLQGKVRQGLTNSGGWARDKMAGQELAGQQNLADRFAGTGGGRYQGVYGAQSDLLNRSALQNRADLARQYEQQVFGQGMGLEGMLGSQYEQAKQRELANQALGVDVQKQNALFGLDWSRLMSGGLGGLADMLKWYGNTDLATQAQNNAIGQQNWGAWDAYTQNQQKAQNDWRNQYDKWLYDQQNRGQYQYQPRIGNMNMNPGWGRIR